MPFQFRHTFAFICVFGQPQNPAFLWDKFKSYLIEDFLRTNSESLAINLALHDISNTLNAHGLHCNNFNLPIPEPILQPKLYDSVTETAKALVMLSNTSVSCMRPLSTQAKEIKLAHLIIIDESSMMTKHALRCIDALLREIMQINTPFGGKVILLGGDFSRIILTTKNDIALTLNNTIISKLPSSLRLYYSSDSLVSDHTDESLNYPPEFLHSLTLSGMPPHILSLKVGTIIILLRYMNPTKGLCNGTRRIILTTKNDIALTLNNTIISKLPSSLRLYYSSDSLVSDHTDESLNYPPEFLHSLTLSGMPPHILSLKVGTIIILLRYMNPTKGLCNGTRLIIKSMHNYFLDAEIITGTNKGYRVFIPRIDLTPSESQLPFILKRR
ncbi:uncharacterized protein LOC135924249 [Gordionus sp. m RMFG-2023]|uniref:uncharacterized protein LOC135924249 n=1 Tax=Gordionus sp. m RMFG-2023 TaxID=3053472 RepID=UPI0031FDE292